MKGTNKKQHAVKNTMNKLAMTIGVVSGSFFVLSPAVQAAETEYSFGGFVKADAMFSQSSDAQRSGGDDFLLPFNIAVGDGSGEGDVVFDSHAKHSRLFFKTVTMTDAGEVKSYVEMDFNGAAGENLTNQSSNGLRHAFISWKNSENSSILAGQTWSTFFNVGALPEAVDFVGPTSGTIFIRQTQLRYTQKMGGGSFMLAAENPSVSLWDTTGALDKAVDDSAMPDLIARYDAAAGDLKYSAAAMVRQINYNDVVSDSDDSQVGVGVTVSGKYSFGNGDDLKFMLSHGQLGRYLALNTFADGSVDTDGDIDLITSMGGFIAYRHMWSEKLRSTVSYAFSEADNSDSLSASATATKSINNANINLMYSPTKKLTFGAEYLIAEREVESGDDGDLSRLQFTSKWAF